ncbi:MAG: FG-GAP repeat domain-containing protein [Terriglobia bacterium]
MNRKSAWLRGTPLTFLAIWTLAAACLASEAPIYSTSLLPGSNASLDQGGAIADLDGDGRPDLAVVRAEGRSVKGFYYRVELQLSAHLGTSSFKLSAPQGGLHIVPRDVNGDGELDLVIMTAWSHSPIGVWINDGHGAFTESDSAAYPTSIWMEGPGIFSNTPREAFQAAVIESHRFSIDSSVGSKLFDHLSVNHLHPPLTISKPPSIAANRPRTRAPPFYVP